MTKVRHTMRRVGFFVQFISRKKSWRAILLVALVGLGTSYLMTLGITSTRGYKIRELERRIEELKFENKKLNLKVAEMQVPGRVAEWVKTSGMVAVSNVQYISETTGMMAVR
ncbi:MAG: hypothetical protein UX17_C0003G0005 [Parcubacteria group bacterium GW2011_GWC2_45_7]|nr:MAG: hypothetical protein UX17_C0003G0005 [Parcubacteria group bacterium GW2011_GWC2_45_7]